MANSAQGSKIKTGILKNKIKGQIFLIQSEHLRIKVLSSVDGRDCDVIPRNQKFNSIVNFQFQDHVTVLLNKIYFTIMVETLHLITSPNSHFIELNPEVLQL